MGKSAWSLPLGSLYVLLVILIFAVPHAAQGAIVYSQLTDEATSTSATLAFFKLPPGTSVPGGLKYIDLIAATRASGHAFQALIICRRFSDYTGNCPEMPDDAVVTGSVGLTNVPTKFTLPFTLGSTTPLSSSRYYAFGIRRTNGEASGIQLRGVTTTNTCIIAGCGSSGTPFVVLYDSEPAPETPDPVIIIPGILGSERNSAGEWVIDPILHTYDDLIATLDVNHYTPGTDLFTFPYNWRKSNVETALLLKQKIDEIKEICECDKVDLVAHSMGGLVARQYIQSDAYEDDVDQLIFLGTPHLGAPKAYLMWEGGEVGPFIDPQATLMEIILRHEGYEQDFPHLFNYIRTIPIDSVRELLPIYDYIFDGTQLRSYPTNYPQNVFLENLKINVDSLLSSGVEIHNIIGSVEPQKTIAGIDAVDTSEYAPKWEHGYPQDFYALLGDQGLLRGSGDGTVPLASASFVNSNLVTMPYEHIALPVQAEGEVYEILTGEEAGTLVQQFINIPNFKLIVIKILSPADIVVIAPNGVSKAGKNVSESERIPNSFYTGFNTETEFITILNPEDGEYKVIAEGTDSGTYTVETVYISDQGVVEASFTGNTTSGLVTELVVPVSSLNPEELEIQPTDAEPPVIIVAQPEAKDYLRSEELPIHVTAEDTSGVLSLATMFDVTPLSSESSIDLFFQLLGTHKVVAAAVDNVGNAATTTQIFRVVATLESILSDVERAYGLGWMVQSVRDKLVDKLQTARTKRGNEQEYDKFLSKDILNELERRRGSGLNEVGYQLLREDILWLINN